MRKLLFLIFVFAVLFGACTANDTQQSPFFSAIFTPEHLAAQSLSDSVNFRGLTVGEPISRVGELEEQTHLRHQDELGFSYEIPLSESVTLLLDYYSDQANSQFPQERITSIVADVLMKEEFETANLYEDIATYFNEQYGVADGGYGQLVWNGYTPFTNNLEVRLILNENKTQITINFVDLQTENPTRS